MTLFQTLGRVMDEGAVLRLECEVCGHRALWGRAAAFARLGADAAPYEIRRRLRCSACGARRQARVWI